MWGVGEASLLLSFLLPIDCMLAQIMLIVLLHMVNTNSIPSAVSRVQLHQHSYNAFITWGVLCSGFLPPTTMAWRSWATHAAFQAEMYDYTTPRLLSLPLPFKQKHALHLLVIPKLMWNKMRLWEINSRDASVTQLCSSCLQSHIINCTRGIFILWLPFWPELWNIGWNEHELFFKSCDATQTPRVEVVSNAQSGKIGFGSESNGIGPFPFTHEKVEELCRVTG